MRTRPNNIEMERDALVKRIYLRLQVIEVLVRELRVKALSDDFSDFNDTESH